MMPVLSDGALRILRARYLKKDREGNVVENPGEMFKRVAKHVARAERSFGSSSRIESTAADFHDMMASLSFLPNSPTLMNAGRDLGQLAACFVLPVEDSLASIFEAVKNTAIIHQSGGGTGFSFSRLRPRNDMVMTTSGVASGPVSFMEVFNKATDVIKQGGTRRGANMGVLRIDHPDIEEFIAVKRDLGRLTCFNLSVGVTDLFMDAVRSGRDFELINPRHGTAARTARAAEIFDLLVRCAWEDGEPGILFLDEISRHNPTPHLGTMEATNPCGEQPLLPYEACTLGSINLSLMTRIRSGIHEIDWDRLGSTVRLAVRFLDDVVEVNRYPLKQIRRISLGNRKIGLGVMGFAHLLIRLGIHYASEQALAVAGEVMGFVPRARRGQGVLPELPGQRLRLSGQGTHAQRNGDHHSPHRDPEHHRRVFLGHRASLCTLLHQDNPRRHRGCRDGPPLPAAGRRGRPPHRTDRGCPAPGRLTAGRLPRAGRIAAALRHGAEDPSSPARAGAGRLPETYRQRRVQDRQLQP
jgi:ribonucleoside-diphosphate reductase alpha chain